MKIKDIPDSLVLAYAVANPDRAVEIAIAHPKHTSEIIDDCPDLRLKIAMHPKAAAEIVWDAVHEQASFEDTIVALAQAHPALVTNIANRAPLHIIAICRAFPGQVQQIIGEAEGIDKNKIIEIAKAVPQAFKLEPEEKEPEPSPSRDLRDWQLAGHLSVRVFNILCREKILSADALASETAKRLESLLNVGKSALAEIRKALAAHGMKLAGD